MFTVRTVTRTAAATGALACALLTSPLPAAANPDTDCADYPTRAAAQEAFEANGGSPTNNWHGLDNDHDGQACEHHRFPGQPTPPPNPGPSGCPACSPTPEPSPSVEPPATPGPSMEPEPTPSVGPVVPPVAEPTAPPVLPVTGPGGPDPVVFAGVGGGVLLAGAALLAVGRRRRA